MAVLHTFTNRGSIRNPKDILYMLYKYFITTLYSQSNVYFGGLSSFKYIVDSNKNDNDAIIYEITNTLTAMCNRYFNSADVMVEFVESQDYNTVSISINITAKTEQGELVVLDSNIYKENNNYDIYRALDELNTK